MQHKITEIVQKFIANRTIVVIYFARIRKNDDQMALLSLMMVWQLYMISLKFVR